MQMNSLKPMKDVLYIVVHCSSTRASQTVTVEDIDRMHKAKGCPCYDVQSEMAELNSPTLNH